MISLLAGVILGLFERWYTKQANTWYTPWLEIQSASNAGYNHKKYSSWQLPVAEACENKPGWWLCINWWLWKQEFIVQKLFSLHHKELTCGLGAWFPIYGFRVSQILRDSKLTQTFILPWSIKWISGTPGIYWHKENCFL